MKHNYLLLLLLLLTACWDTDTPIKTIRPVKLAEVEPLSLYSREFIGRFEASEQSELAFAVSGTIQDFNIETGEKVRKGQVLARILPSDYKLKLEAEKSMYQTSKANYERSGRLLKRGAISLQEYEISESTYEASRARYLYAERELANTELKAPFSGSIEAKYVSDYAEVVAGQSICKLIDPRSLDVEFTLPHSDISLTLLKDSFSVVVGSESFSAEVSEVVDASVDGAGIPVTLKLTDSKFNPQSLGYVAGLGCRVRVEVNRSLTEGDYTIVPLCAIFADALNASQRSVWVYNPKSGSVASRIVVLEGLIGKDTAIVRSGLNSGELVVTAGVNSLSQGQVVKPL